MILCVDIRLIGMTFTSYSNFNFNIALILLKTQPKSNHLNQF